MDFRRARRNAVAPIVPLASTVDGLPEEGQRQATPFP